MEGPEGAGVSGAEGYKPVFSGDQHLELGSLEGGPVMLADDVLEITRPVDLTDLEADL